MDSIRLRQINEVLNYDKNINAMVFSLEKKRTATFPDEEVLPCSQIAEEMGTNIQQGSNALKVMLESKIASVAQLIRAVWGRFWLLVCPRRHICNTADYSSLQPGRTTVQLPASDVTDQG